MQTTDCVLSAVYFPQVLPDDSHGFSGLLPLQASLEPHPTNNRAPCERVAAQARDSDPLFSAEQEYTMIDPATAWPTGWPTGGQAGSPSRVSYGGSGALGGGGAGKPACMPLRRLSTLPWLGFVAQGQVYVWAESCPRAT